MEPSPDQIAVMIKDVTKTFDKTVANDKITLDIRRGEILALLGENGSGKTTLMNMLSGIYFPDAGEIYINGKPATIRSPKDAFALGIGMVHQHFKLVDVFSAAENIVLGLPGGVKINRRALSAEIREISARYGFELDPDKKIYNMSVSEKQTVEIVKVLYRGADILILDEPTAVLTPQETMKLFAVLRKMKADNKAIVIITHKLNEVLEVSDRVHILRKGQYVGTVNTAETNTLQLTEKMVGRAVSLAIERPEVAEKKLKMQVSGLTCLNNDGIPALADVSFDLYGGEILGVAGIAGSGQKELCEALAGLHPVKSGSIIFHRQDENCREISEDVAGLPPMEFIRRGIAMSFVPEDRLGMGLVAAMDMTDNVMLRSYYRNKGPFVDRKTPRALAEQLIEQLEIITPGVSTPVRLLSGGNVQKVLLGREIACSPQVLIVAYPVRGLDINSSYTIYNLLNQQKQRGVAVLFVGEDLDVLLEICDRILVLCGGSVSGIVDAHTAGKEQLGLLMTQKGGAAAAPPVMRTQSCDPAEREAECQDISPDVDIVAAAPQANGAQSCDPAERDSECQDISPDVDIVAAAPPANRGGNTGASGASDRPQSCDPAAVEAGPTGLAPNADEKSADGGYGIPGRPHGQQEDGGEAE